MDSMKYDYYGNYEDDNENSFTFSVSDIHKKQKQREKNRLKIYEVITARCFKKIKEVSLNEETFCFYILPEYLPGYPIYNMTECVVFMLNVLKEKGFNARYCDNYTIYISWNIPKPNLRLMNSPQPVIEKKNVMENLNLKYKPIENYTAFSNFLPKKKF